MKKDKEEINGVNYFFISERTHKRELIDRIVIFSIIAIIVIVTSVVCGLSFAKKHNDEYANLVQDMEQNKDSKNNRTRKFSRRRHNAR